MTLIIMTLRTMVLILKTQHSAKTTLSITLPVVMLDVAMLGVTFINCYAECCCAECHYAECGGVLFKASKNFSIFRLKNCPHLKHSVTLLESF
jgi:hypothetical protein